MAGLGYISEAEKTAAEKSKIQLKLRTPPNDCISTNKVHRDWGFFCDEFKQWWLQQPAFGQTQDERLDSLRRGGWKVVTSISPRVQAAANSAVLDNKSKNSPMALGEVMIERDLLCEKIAILEAGRPLGRPRPRR